MSPRKNRRGKSTAWQTPAALVVILFCLTLFSWAGLRANAAFHFYAAQSIATPLFESGVITASEADASSGHLDKALKRWPRNPDYLDFSGRFKVLRSHQTGVLGREHTTLLESAAADFRKALVVRPLWPYSWANLLSVKDRLGQVDAEFDRIMSRVAETGPWERRVQLQLLRSGVRNWDEISKTSRALVRAKMMDALRVQPREVFEIARFYARPDLVCVSGSDHPQINAWCANVL